MGADPSLRRVAGMSSVIAPWKARDTASALASPVTRKAIVREDRNVGMVMVTRSTHGSRPAGPLVARRSSTRSCGEWAGLASVYLLHAHALGLVPLPGDRVAA